MSSPTQIQVQSNVARDILSTADSFGSIPKAVVEYVSNPLDSPAYDGQRVQVTLTWRRYGTTTLTITDDASGMDRDDLQRFWTMHHENEARRQGRTARGRFGTGKAAAFGIGDSLTVDTVRNGHHWKMRLTKAELLSAAAENRPPVPKVLVDGAATTSVNGTTVTIGGVGKQVNEASIGNELRKRLGRVLDAHQIMVKGVRLVIEEPPPRRTWVFRSDDDPMAAAVVPGVECTISVASNPVSEAIRGVIITANSTPVAQIPVPGADTARVWGHCEAPALDADGSTPGPYSDSRDLNLNEENATAGPLLQWVRSCLNEVVAALAKEDRERRLRAQDEALQRAANQLEEVLNRHYQGEFRRARMVPRTGRPRASDATPDPDGDLRCPDPGGRAGYEPEAADENGQGEPGPRPEPRPPGPDPSPGPEPSPRGTPHERDPLGSGRGDPMSGKGGQRRQRGGFTIDFEDAGLDASRSRYITESLTIRLNRQHPQLAAVYAGGGDSPPFRMLAFEAAAQEYCYATAYQLLEEGELDEYEVVEHVRATMDALARSGAHVAGGLASSAPLAASA